MDSPSSSWPWGALTLCPVSCSLRVNVVEAPRSNRPWCSQERTQCPKPRPAWDHKFTAQAVGSGRDWEVRAAGVCPAEGRATSQGAHPPSSQGARSQPCALSAKKGQTRQLSEVPSAPSRDSSMHPEGLGKDSREVYPQVLLQTSPKLPFLSGGKVRRCEGSSVSWLPATQGLPATGLFSRSGLFHLGHVGCDCILN